MSLNIQQTNSESELALRAHIRYLLNDYVKEHLTTDYIAYTEESVGQLLAESLLIIPVTDPNYIALPEDPFDTLFRRLHLSNLEPHDEKFIVSKETASYIKKTAFVKLDRLPLKTETVWNVERDFDYQKWAYRPMSPTILTTRETRNTPRLGSCLNVNSPSINFKQFLSTHSIGPLEVPGIPDPPSVSLNDVLDLKFSIDSEHHKFMLQLFNQVPAFLRPPDTAFKSRGLEALLRYDSPPAIIERSISPPIFPRSGRPGRAARNFADDCYTSLQKLKVKLPLVKIEEDEDEDLYKQHLCVIDGWETYASSPNRVTPSLDDRSSEVDELVDFLPSPPNARPPAIQSLMDAKQETVMFPRTSKIGHAKPKAFGSDKNLDLYSLSSFLALNPVMKIRSKRSPRAMMASTLRSSSPVSASMLGQPPSVTSGHNEEQIDTIGDEDEDRSDGLDDAIQKIYKNVQDDDPKAFLIQEKLQEEDGFLMDGCARPPPPNVHPDSSRSFPQDLAALVAPPKKPKTQEIASGADTREVGFLRKVKGLPPLTLELSWIPFKCNFAPPSHADVVRVSTVEVEEDEVDRADVRKYLDTSLALAEDAYGAKWDASLVPRGFEDSESAGMKLYWDKPDMGDYMLTREERRRRDGLPTGIREYDNEPLADPSEGKHDHDVDQLETRFLDDDRPTKRARLESTNGNENDDSGIAFADAPARSTVESELVEYHFGEEDKENLPPTMLHVSHSTDYEDFVLPPPGDQDSQLESIEGLSEIGDFAPLSLEPQNTAEHIDVFDSEASFLGRAFDDLQPRSGIEDPRPLEGKLPINEVPANDGRQTSAKSDLQVTNSTSTYRSLVEFMAMRSKRINEPPPADTPQPVEEAVAPIMEHSPSPPPGVPNELIDRNTLVLPAPWLTPSSLHRYLVSVDLIQKQALVRTMRDPGICAIELVERDYLGDVDLILDPHTAVIVTSLLALPSTCGALTAQLSTQSWRYAQILVVFEAFPSRYMYKYRQEEQGRGGLYAFSPPIVKAVRKLRRDLGIAEGSGAKRAITNVHFAFANTVEEAAIYVRVYGNGAEANDVTGGVLWGGREWLEEEEHEDERSLATIDGMNTFAAFIMLYKRPLQAFLDMSPEARIDELGIILGEDRIVQFNEIIESRSREMAMEFSGDPDLQSEDIIVEDYGKGAWTA